MKTSNIILSIIKGEHVAVLKGEMQFFTLPENRGKLPSCDRLLADLPPLFSTSFY